MERSHTNSGKIEGFQKTGDVWQWRYRTWQTVILSVSCIVLAAPQASADLRNETAVMLGIKQAWGNPSILDAWSTNFNTCTWAYVGCNPQNTTIVSLELLGRTNAPPIYIPESIVALVNLETILINSWGLTGEIPSSIGLLKNLKILNLKQNSLNGSIPAEIGNLTKLETLYLASNFLTGPLPDSLSALKNLSFLSLSSNQISGSIPAWIGSFPVLEYLYLGQNMFTGPLPPSVGNLGSLIDIVMTSAWTSSLSVGSLPTELGQLSSLMNLNLGQNMFQGSIPDSLGNLTALTSLDLSSCSLSGTIPSSFGNLSDLTTIDLSSNFLSGTIPDIGNDTLTSLDLHSNSLVGPIPRNLDQMPNLTSIDLSYNFLDGGIPQPLVNLPQLTTISLENNCLTGTIPNFNKTLLTADFGQTGDSNCFNASQVCKCGGAPAPAFEPPVTAGGHSNSSKSQTIYIAVGVVLGSLLALFGLLVFCFLRHKHQPKSLNHSRTYKGLVREYSVVQIRDATKNFMTKVGEGAFSTVYKASFEDGTIAAVKRFNKRRPVESFEKEVQLLSSLNHRFLVNLVGYCEDLDEGEHILLYEFMDRGNLNEVLHGSRDHSRVPLTWDERVRVLISVAHGIDYLHYGTDPPMIHRDIKSANILLSSSGNTLIAKLADFGLGRQTVVDADIMTATFGNEPPKAFFSTKIAGTPGYFDPEYVNTSVLSAKIDIYSYGVVLLELLTGKPPVLDDNSTLAEWAKSFLVDENICAIVDPQLGKGKGTCDEQQVRTVAELAYRCTEIDGSKRPTIKEVIAFLTRLFNVETRMVNPSLRISSSTVGFSETDSTISSQSRNLTTDLEMNSVNYTNSEILPQD